MKPALDSTLTPKDGQPDGRAAWDRRTDESVRAFEAFRLFRDMAGARTMQSVATQLRCSGANIRRWSARHAWADRVLAFDIAEDERTRAELSRGRIEMRKRHLKLALLAQSIAAHALAELSRRAEQQLPLEMSPEEARGLLATATKLERDTLGAEKQSRYTKINVNFRLHEHEDERVTGQRDEDSPPVLDGDEKDKLIN